VVPFPKRLGIFTCLACEEAAEFTKAATDDKGTFPPGKRAVFVPPAASPK
jgi:hypothetical protein